MLQKQNWAQNICMELESLASFSGACNYKTVKANFADPHQMN